MHILEAIPRPYTANPKYGEFAEPLAERFTGLSAASVIYRLRAPIFDALVTYGAELYEESRQAGRSKKHYIVSNPIAMGLENEVLFAFDKHYPKTVLWQDRILAYIAFHDGFLRKTDGVLTDGFTLDTTYPDAVYPYEQQEYNRPRSIKDWENLSEAWFEYLMYAVDEDHDPDQSPATQQALRHTMTLVRLEMGYTIDFVDRDSDFTLLFTGGGEKRPSFRFWVDKTDPDPARHSVKYAQTSPKGITGFPQLLTLGQLRHLAFETIREWHAEAGLEVQQAMERFDVRDHALRELQHQDFNSGLERYKAPVESLTFKKPRP